jgi:hypothetical protein
MVVMSKNEDTIWSQVKSLQKKKHEGTGAGCAGKCIGKGKLRSTRSFHVGALEYIETEHFLEVNQNQLGKMFDQLNRWLKENQRTECMKSICAIRRPRKGRGFRGHVITFVQSRTHKVKQSPLSGI